MTPMGAAYSIIFNEGDSSTMVEILMERGTIQMTAIEIGNLKLWTVREIAKKLSLTEVTIRTYIKDGKLKAKRIGKQFLIDEADLINFLKRQ